MKKNIKILYPDNPKFKFLDTEEKELILDTEKNMDSFVPVTDRKKLDSIHHAARNTYERMRKESQINMRVNSDDLEKVKQRAAVAGIPYQTYLSLLIRSAAQGKFEIRI
ncbi:MAG: CopG family antitoxin [bacterium]